MRGNSIPLHVQLIYQRICCITQKGSFPMTAHSSKGAHSPREAPAHKIGRLRRQRRRPAGLLCFFSGRHRTYGMGRPKHTRRRPKKSFPEPDSRPPRRARALSNGREIGRRRSTDDNRWESIPELSNGSPRQPQNGPGSPYVFHLEPSRSGFHLDPAPPPIDARDRCCFSVL